MLIRSILLLLAFLQISLFQNLQAASRPNVLLLFADDQRADSIHAWGNDQIQTPAIDRLVQRGTSFRNNYCFGSNSGAVCVPSRAMLHTAKTWLHTDANMKGSTTLGQHFQAHGYRTFATGKWHNGAESILKSFAAGKNVFMGGMCDHTQVPINDIVAGKLQSRGIGSAFSSQLFADAAIEFLEANKNSSDPFLAYVAFTAPHDPRNPPQKYRDIYYAQPPRLPANFLPQHPFDNGSLVIRDEYLAPWPRPEKMVQEQLCEYYGLITHLDEQVGRILHTLEQTGQAENTIVVYAADHGLAMGSHGLLGKQSVYEHSMKCPLIIAGPGIPQQQTEAFTYLLDIFPTLCQLCDLPAPAAIDGKSLQPILESPQATLRETVFLPYQKTQRAIRHGRWKLIVYPQINHIQLFDLQADPHELHDLAADPTHANTVSRMKTLLEQNQQTADDDQPLSVVKPKKKEIDLAGHSRKPDTHQPEWILEKYFSE